MLRTWLLLSSSARPLLCLLLLLLLLLFLPLSLLPRLRQERQRLLLRPAAVAGTPWHAARRGTFSHARRPRRISGLGRPLRRARRLLLPRHDDRGRLLPLLRAAAAADALAIARTAFAAPPSAGEATRALKTALNIRCDGGDVTDDGHSSSGVSSCVGSPALGGAEDGALPSPPPLRLPVRVLRRSQEDDWRELVMSTARLVLGEAEVPLAPFAAPAPVRRA